MKLIVGLGNPGREYENTRHNCGFKVIKKLENELNSVCNQVKFKGLYTKCRYKGEDVILLKPQTFMNLSGESIIQVMNFFKMNVSDVLVIYDDLDTKVGNIRLRKNGSAGGHNGIKSIISHLHTQEFYRIRVGIDRVKEIPIVDYVLGKFPKAQEKEFDVAFTNAAKAAMLFIEGKFEQAMNEYN